MTCWELEDFLDNLLSVAVIEEVRSKFRKHLECEGQLEIGDEKDDAAEASAAGLLQPGACSNRESSQEVKSASSVSTLDVTSSISGTPDTRRSSRSSSDSGKAQAEGPDTGQSAAAKALPEEKEKMSSALAKQLKEMPLEKVLSLSPEDMIRAVSASPDFDASVAPPASSAAVEFQPVPSASAPEAPSLVSNTQASQVVPSASAPEAPSLVSCTQASQAVPSASALEAPSLVSNTQASQAVGQGVGCTLLDMACSIPGVGPVSRVQPARLAQPQAQRQPQTVQSALASLQTTMVEQQALSQIQALMPFGQEVGGDAQLLNQMMLTLAQFNPSLTTTPMLLLMTAVQHLKSMQQLQQAASAAAARTSLLNTVMAGTEGQQETASCNTQQNDFLQNLMAQMNPNPAAAAAGTAPAQAASVPGGPSGQPGSSTSSTTSNRLDPGPASDWGMTASNKSKPPGIGGIFGARSGNPTGSASESITVPATACTGGSSKGSKVKATEQRSGSQVRLPNSSPSVQAMAMVITEPSQQSTCSPPLDAPHSSDNSARPAGLGESQHEMVHGEGTAPDSDISTPWKALKPARRLPQEPEQRPVGCADNGCDEYPRFVPPRLREQAKAEACQAESAHRMDRECSQKKPYVPAALQGVDCVTFADAAKALNQVRATSGGGDRNPSRSHEGKFKEAPRPFSAKTTSCLSPGNDGWTMVPLKKTQQKQGKTGSGRPEPGTRKAVANDSRNSTSSPEGVLAFHPAVEVKNSFNFSSAATSDAGGEDWDEEAELYPKAFRWQKSDGSFTLPQHQGRGQGRPGNTGGGTQH